MPPAVAGYYAVLAVLLFFSVENIHYCDSGLLKFKTNDDWKLHDRTIRQHIFIETLTLLSRTINSALPGGQSYYPRIPQDT